jgi:hypothetical protein
VTDVEHTAEFTTDPFLAMRGAFGLTARAARTAFYNAHEVLDSTDPASAFAGVNDLGRTRFRSYFFTASGPLDDPEDAIDVFLNGRAVAPAVALSGRGTLASGHPALADLRAWAAGLRDDALLSASKPEGFPWGCCRAPTAAARPRIAGSSCCPPCACSARRWTGRTRASRRAPWAASGGSRSSSGRGRASA